MTSQGVRRGRLGQAIQVDGLTGHRALPFAATDGAGAGGLLEGLHDVLASEAQTQRHPTALQPSG